MGYKGLASTMPDEEFINIVTSSFTYVEILRKLGYTALTGGPNKTIKRRIKKLNIDTSHMTHYNYKSREVRRTFTDDEVFCENSTYKGAIRSRILRDNLIPYECSICGNKGEWNGKPLTLTLDHINGNHLDNRLENLRFVCPNCDRQLDTFGSKNKVRYYEPSFSPKKVGICSKCGKEINHGCEMCVDCRNEERRSKVPLKEDLEKELKNFTSFLALGRKYGVSDNAVRKWCKRYNLPYKASDIKKLTNS